MSAAIVFAESRSNNTDIYSVATDGSGLIRLTSDPKTDEAPDWSPDGKHIAFSSNRDGSTKIYVMDRWGSNVVQLTRGGSMDMYPDWSPDGSKIAFTSDDGSGRDVYVMNADGSDATRLTYGGLVEYTKPAWSPDGRFIAFITTFNGRDLLTVMDADGSNLIHLQETETARGVLAYSPDWSSDGTRIAYLTTEVGSNDMWSQILVIDLSGQTGIRLVAGKDQNLANLRWLAWSPDGEKLLVAGSFQGLQVVTFDGAGVNRLSVNQSYSASSPDWFMPGLEALTVAVARPINNPTDPQLIAALASVCQVGAVATQPEYRPGAGPHPIAAFKSTPSSPDWQATLYPGLRLPRAGATEVQLVACIVETWELVEPCVYVSDDSSTRRTVQRGQQHVYVNVYAAQSGIPVDSFDLFGAYPQACPPTLGLYEANPSLGNPPLNEEELYSHLDRLYYDQ